MYKTEQDYLKVGSWTCWQTSQKWSASELDQNQQLTHQSVCRWNRKNGLINKTQTLKRFINFLKKLKVFLFQAKIEDTFLTNTER